MNMYESKCNFNFPDEYLRKPFTTYYEMISAEIIYHTETNRSRTFGFVEVCDHAVSYNSIQELHETDMEGRIIDAMQAYLKGNKQYCNSNKRSSINNNNYQFN